MTVPKQWEIDDDAVEELRKVLPRYPSSLARAIANEAAIDFNDEHYASHADYALARWFDAVLNRAAQPQPFIGCQLRGPGECQNHGMCLSDACLHAGKTIRPRYMAEPKEDGIKYPSFAERNLIDRFGPKEPT